MGFYLAFNIRVTAFAGINSALERRTLHTWCPEPLLRACVARLRADAPPSGSSARRAASRSLTAAAWVSCGRAMNWSSRGDRFVLFFRVLSFPPPHPTFLFYSGDLERDGTRTWQVVLLQRSALGENLEREREREGATPLDRIDRNYNPIATIGASFRRDSSAPRGLNRAWFELVYLGSRGAGRTVETNIKVLNGVRWAGRCDGSGCGPTPATHAPPRW